MSEDADDGDKMYRLFASAQLAAFNRVLSYLNTLEDRMVDKHVIYRRVFSMLPNGCEIDSEFAEKRDVDRLSA